WRLFLLRRAQEGHHSPARREHFGRGARSRRVQSSAGVGSGGDRRAFGSRRRGHHGGRGAQARCTGTAGGGYRGVVSPPSGADEGAAVCVVRRVTPAHAFASRGQASPERATGLARQRSRYGTAVGLGETRGRCTVSALRATRVAHLRGLTMRAQGGGAF